MSNRMTLIVGIALLATSCIVAVALYPRMPTPMASHWDANGQVNGYVSTFWGLFLMPLMTTGLFLLLWAIPNIDPLKANIAKFRGIYNAFIVLFVVYMLYIYALTLVWNLGYNTFDMTMAILPAMGLFFIFLGVMMGKAQRNFFIGIRTPWTLSSDTVWAKTHSLGSKLFIGAGILTLLAIPLGEYGMWLFLVLILIASLVPVVYSYILWKQETKAHG
jgi:immunity protein, SdpI family